MKARISFTPGSGLSKPDLLVGLCPFARALCRICPEGTNDGSRVGSAWDQHRVGATVRLARRSLSDWPRLSVLISHALRCDSSLTSNEAPPSFFLTVAWGKMLPLRVSPSFRIHGNKF